MQARLNTSRIHLDDASSNTWSPPAWTRLTLALLALLVASPGLAEDAGVSEAEKLLPTKALICNSNTHQCTGSFKELIQWLKTYPDGRVEIHLQQTVSNNITASLGCSFIGGFRVDVSPTKDTDGGEENILDQLYLSAALNSRVRMKFTADSGGQCQIEHIFAYFEPA